MPFLLSLLAGFVTTEVVTALVTRAVVALGFAAVTFTGLYFALNAAIAHINANFGQVGQGVSAMLVLSHVPQGLNVVLSSYGGAMILRGLTAAGAVTKVGISSAPGAVFSPGTF